MHDLQVDHEPSVPTLEVLLLSCLAYAAVHNLATIGLQWKPGGLGNNPLKLCILASIVAVLFELIVSMPGNLSCSWHVYLNVIMQYWSCASYEVSIASMSLLTL